MSLAKIMRHFEGIGRVPVDLPDVIQQFQQSGILEKIEIRGLDKSAAVLRGVHYRYRIQPSLGSALGDERRVLIPYSTQQSLEWQRLVICKELVHLYDPMPVTTKAREDVLQLASKLASSNNKPTIKGNGIQHLFDVLAKYQAMAIMFPYGLHEELLPRYLRNEVDVHKIAAFVQLPWEYVDSIMVEEWKALRESILD